MYLGIEPKLFHTLYEIKLATEDDPVPHNHPHLEVFLKGDYFFRRRFLLPIYLPTLHGILLAIEDDPIWHNYQVTLKSSWMQA